MHPPFDGPVRVALIHDSRVVHAGLRHLTAPYSDRILVLPDAGPSTTHAAHVVLHGDLRPPQFTRVTRNALEVVYAFRPRPEVVRAAVQHGAAGHADKNWTARQLVTAIEQAVSGWRAKGPAVARGRELVSVPADDVQDAGLSPREIELLGLVAPGLRHDDNAGLMSVSGNAVKSYIRAADRKIGVTRRTQAVLWVLSHDLDRVGGRVASPPAGTAPSVTPAVAPSH